MCSSDLFAPVALQPSGGRVTLPAGRHRLVAEARDRRGRVGTATVRVVVRPAKPRFTRLSGPRRVSQRARAVTLRVAATFPTTLRIAGRRLAVGPRPALVRVRLRPGAAPARLLAVLASGRLRTTARITVVRR